MGEGLIETKRRIESIESTSKITSAMKLVATVKLKRWRTLLDNNVPYFESYKETMERLLKYVSLEDATKFSSTLNSYPNSTKKLYIVVTSDLGLCGGYNYGAYKKLESVVKPEDEIIFIGSKGSLHFKGLKNKMYYDFESLLNDFTYENVRLFRHKLVRLYNEKQYKSVELIYTHYVNSLTFEPTIEKLLPLEKPNIEAEKLESKDILFEDSASECIEAVLPHYIDAYLYNKLIESVVCESASRRNAMENSTKNADDIMASLKIKYNKARQGQITQEITEVVAGANNIQ